MASYELRLLDQSGKTQTIVQFSSATDEVAKFRIFSVSVDYSRFELWKGMEMIASGGRFIVARPFEGASYFAHEVEGRIS